MQLSNLLQNLHFLLPALLLYVEGNTPRMQDGHEHVVGLAY
jgi:hypothetical protein